MGFWFHRGSTWIARRASLRRWWRVPCFGRCTRTSAWTKKWTLSSLRRPSLRSMAAWTGRTVKEWKWVINKYTHTYIYIYIYIHTYIHLWVCVCIHIHMYIYIWEGVCVYIYILVHIDDLSIYLHLYLHFFFYFEMPYVCSDEFKHTLGSYSKSLQHFKFIGNSSPLHLAWGMLLWLWWNCLWTYRKSPWLNPALQTQGQ